MFDGFGVVSNDLIPIPKQERPSEDEPVSVDRLDGQTLAHVVEFIKYHAAFPMKVCAMVVCVIFVIVRAVCDINWVKSACVVACCSLSCSLQFLLRRRLSDLWNSTLLSKNTSTNLMSTFST